MKKRLLCIISAALLCFVCGACTPTDTPETTTAATETATPTAAPATTVTHTPTTEEDEMTDDGTQPNAVRWLANEIVFTSDTEYTEPVYTVDMDVVFTNSETGKTFTMPAFWNGGKEWRVRFALTEPGHWTYSTTCTDTANTGLHMHKGELECVLYDGDLPIYQHGFVRTETGTHYFMYDDGTPFFYLGDTHWTLPVEELDGIGNIPQELADEYGITSQFKYIMDYRAEQGYTVIQSQQLSWYEGAAGNSWMGDAEGTVFTYGVDENILAKFRTLDEYFKYIAEKGFVHSHTQFAYPEELIEDYLGEMVTAEKLEKLCRYWVARYSAYPVMWATAQEGDNDYYEWEGCNSENNPWLLVMDYISKYDVYDHPTTCHQENATSTRVSNSAFGGRESHQWYAAQFSPSIKNGSVMNWKMLREYWENEGSKPVVNYEGRYDHFWTGTFGARAQGWTAYLNGCFGYGYGVQPIWSIVWADYGEKTVTSDEKEEYDRGINWVEGLYSEAGAQLIYMKDFLERYEWWKLTPCFNNSEYYLTNGSNYSVSTIENKLYIAYFYGSGVNNNKLGSFTGMADGDYELCWFNCRTGETTTETVTVTGGVYQIPGKVDNGDWVLSARLIEA